MPTVFSHAIGGLAIGSLFWRPEIPARFWVLGAACAALPDLDTLGFRFGIDYGAVLGHRGLTHSLVFAAVLGAVVVFVAFPEHSLPLPRSMLWLYFFLATASHGVLDAFTNGGLGVAFFAPFDNSRYFFPVTPIQVSPIGMRAFLTARGMRVIRSELTWIWLPALVLSSAALAIRRKLSAEPPMPGV